MQTHRLFTGTATALVTPFTADDAIDEAAFRRLIDRQLEGGVEGLVVLGTTGESPTVSLDERRRLVDAAVEHAAGRAPVIVGTGNNDTRASAALSKEAADAGADALLIVGPYYNKPPQDGFRAHIAAIAAATGCPIIVYNVPGRTGSNITAETMLRIADEVPTVIGVKEASGNLAQITDLIAHRPDRLAVYAGDDEITLPVLALGGDGVVSVVSNALPALFSELVRAGLSGDFARARTLHLRLLPAIRACFYESNPLPVKAVMAAAGWMEERLRPPLVPLSQANRQRVFDAFSDFMNL